MQPRQRGSLAVVPIAAQRSNTIVDAVVEVGRFFTTPFHDMFPQGNRDRGLSINWGVGALAYVVVGTLIARFVR